LTRKALVESSEQAAFNDKLIMIFMEGHLRGPLGNHCMNVFQLWNNIASWREYL